MNEEKILNNSESQEKREKEAFLKSEWVYRGRLVNLRIDNLKSKDFNRKIEVVEHSGAVVMIPIDKEGKILLVKQWRAPIKQIIIELPAGTLEEGEDPVSCAQRELQEEIGHQANKITPLGGFFSAPGFCTEYLHLFLAEDLKEKTLLGDDDEGIDILPCSLESSLNMIEDGIICDAKTIAGILRYKDWIFLKKDR